MFTIEVKGPINVFLAGAEDVQHIKHALANIQRNQEQFMNAIQQAFTDFIAAQKAHNDKMEASIQGLVVDQKTQSDSIAALTKAIADAGDGSVPQPIADAAAEVAAQNATQETNIAALDALTPPPAPVVPAP